jgi:heptaprenyl diphosphate synthase
VEEEAAVPNGVNWGNKFSVLLSDFLLARAFELCSGLDQRASGRIMESFESAYAGHLRQHDRAWDTSLGRDEYLRQLRRKYAPLFVLPCTLGALLAEAPGAVPALARYGRALSLSYAITEDVRLLTDPGEVTNSAMGTDYARGLLSLPVIEALASGRAPAQRIRDMYRARSMDLAVLRQAVLECGVLAKVQATAARHAARARREAEALEQDVGTRLLARLAVFSVERSIRPDQRPFPPLD